MRMKFLVILALLASSLTAQESKWKMRFDPVYDGLKKDELNRFFEDFEKEYGKKEIQRIETEWSDSGGVIRVEFNPEWDEVRECWNYKLLYFDLTKGDYTGLKLSDWNPSMAPEIQSKVYFGSSRREGTILGANIGAKEYEMVRKILAETESVQLHSYGEVKGGALRWSIKQLFYENEKFYIRLSSPFGDSLRIEKVDGEFRVSSHGVIVSKS